MTRKTRSFHDVRLERLADPNVAAQYLDATMENSPDHFVAALRNVAEAHQIAGLAEQENPTLETLSSILGRLGLRLAIAVGSGSPPPYPPTPAASGDAMQR